MKNNQPSLPLLLFDSECTLCTRFKITLEKVAPTDSIHFASIHDQEIFKQFPQIDYESCSEQIHLIDHQQKVYRGSDAINKIISLFPIASKFSWLLESGMGKKSIDYFYKMADQYRKSLLNRCHTCK